VNTVKTHVKSVYRKLDVRSRREAVARARELRLI
jgi:LuxR family transcriptional regulator, maltose regulon positive regulatory protein